MLMMFMIVHLLEFLLFSVVHTGPNLTESKKQMNWFESLNYCKLSTPKNVKELNATNVWLGGLYLQTPWMVHRGCFNNTGTWDAPPYSLSNIEWNITSSCSYKCRKKQYFCIKVYRFETVSEKKLFIIKMRGCGMIANVTTLHQRPKDVKVTSICHRTAFNNEQKPYRIANRCTCLNSLFNMEKTKIDHCNYTCKGSKDDPCGYSGLYTVYEQEVCSSNTNSADFEKLHKVENGTTYNRRPVIKWIMNETFAQICNETADFHNVKCLLLNQSLQYVPMSCNLSYSALCESGSEIDETADFHNIKCLLLNESLQYVPMSCNLNYSALCESGSERAQQNVPVVSTTASPGTKPLVPANIIKVTVITVVGILITIVIAVIVILIFHRRKRKRTEFNSRKTVITYNCYDMSWSGEGEQTMQMLSNNNRSNNRTNAVPFILQQTQRPGNISLSNCQDPVDMDNQYKRLDFTMRNDAQKSLKEVHNDYSMHYNKGTSSPAVNDDGSKFSKRNRLSEWKNDSKEVHNNYSLPYDSLTNPPVVNNDDKKQNEIKAGPSVTTKDVEHEHVAYCDAAIVHENFLYDIPKHSSKSVDNRCSVKK